MTERTGQVMIYLDNAATSWPKPECVHRAVQACMREVGANPGRSAHRLANEAERLRLDARQAVAELFGVSDPMRVIFTLNATEALNLVIQGLLSEGSHVVTTSMEHNAVMRPIQAVKQGGVSVSVAKCHQDGTTDAGSIEELVRPETRLIVVNHASNVCGTVLPVSEIGAVARSRGIPMLVDAAQTAGCWPTSIPDDNIDLLAFTGHKSLFGPSGTGGLAINDLFDVSELSPMTFGGTGSRSEQETHPDFLPDKYESGTPNSAGLAGLAAGVGHVLERGVEEIRCKERNLTQRLIDGLKRIPGVSVLGTGDARAQTAVVSFVMEGWSCSEVANVLDERFGILCRPGLHCAPRAHRTLGTLPEGTVRFSLSLFTTEADIDKALEAVADLARGTCGE